MFVIELLLGVIGVGLMYLDVEKMRQIWVDWPTTPAPKPLPDKYEHPFRPSDQPTFTPPPPGTLPANYSYQIPPPASGTDDADNTTIGSPVLGSGGYTFQAYGQISNHSGQISVNGGSGTSGPGRNVSRIDFINPYTFVTVYRFKVTDPNKLEKWYEYQPVMASETTPPIANNIYGFVNGGWIWNGMQAYRNQAFFSPDGTQLGNPR